MEDRPGSSDDDELLQPRLPDQFIFETSFLDNSSSDDNSDSEPSASGLPEVAPGKENGVGPSPLGEGGEDEPTTNGSAHIADSIETPLVGEGPEEEEPTTSKATSDVATSVEPRPFSESSEEASSINGSADTSSLTRKPKWEFEVVIKPLPESLAQEYTPVPGGETIYCILEKVPSNPRESWFRVEYDDGHEDLVAFDEIQQQQSGAHALIDYNMMDSLDLDEDDDPRPIPSTRKRKAQDPDYESDGDSGEDEPLNDVDDEVDEKDRLMNPRKRHRSARASTTSSGMRLRRSGRNRRSPSIDNDPNSEGEASGRNVGRFHLRNTSGWHSIQNRKRFAYGDYEDPDELGNDNKDDDHNLTMVTSDIQPRKRGRKPRGKRKAAGYSLRERESSIEFEQPRRSNRSTKNIKMMKESMADEDLYVEVDKGTSTPKAIGAKEVFQPVEDSDFHQAHCSMCDTCGYGPNVANKGTMIYCQGCSMSYHKVCLGYRSTREHAVTKVGPNSFVLQCRHCIGVWKKKDAHSPSLDICQVCKKKGPACAAFAPKRTARQEEKLREGNGGEDPSAAVAPGLINNAQVVLFRCTSCHRSYHFEHLPAPNDLAKEGVDIRAERLAEYSIDWKCKDCREMIHKVDVLVAWRPTDKDSYIEGQTTTDLSEDAKEYLVKWDTKSYAHCEWRPGPWVWGVTNSVMRTAFPKRHNGENLLPKWTAQEAIPEEYLLYDVILAVQHKDHYRYSNKEDDLRKVYLVHKVRVKFQGLDYADAVWDELPPPDSGPQWTAFVAAYQEYLNGKHFKTEPAKTIKERINEFRQKNFTKEIEFSIDPLDQPKGLKHGKLMKYQVQGLNWLLHNFYEQRNVVLADEMGLGKTIQVISLIAALALQGPRCWPFLVVVPNSTCPNWRREIKQWAPDLRVVTYHGGKQPQKLAYDHELFPDGSKEMKAHVVVMSYDSAQDDYTRVLFKSVQWVGLVVDEGQRLKNDKNLLYGALRVMKIPFRLLLTGTPLQNNKRELFNLLQFIDSQKKAAQLDEQYREVTAENIGELHKLIRPYFLRRTKAQVLKFLPPMAQIIVPVSMSIVQEKLCKSIIAKNPELIRAIFAKGKVKATERGSLNNILIQLRKCLCHPFVYSGAVEDKDADPDTMFRNLVEASSKLVLLNIMLPKLKERGHRVLMFSQFLGELDIIEDFLNGLGYKYQRLDGMINSLTKQRRIDAFNESGSEDFAFLLTTRAGGVGINLATADTVIILDPDFNPHQDIQALSRAHRIGQKKKVLCFQLMTKSSVEEKIMQIGRKKMALDHALIESMDIEDDAGNDLESILKHGADALFNGTEKDHIKYDSASVDRLLDRSQAENTQTNDAKSAESQFSFARVWANDEGALTDDIGVSEEPETIDTSVWDKIIKEREEQARILAEKNKEILGRGSRRRNVVNYSGDLVDERHDRGERDVDGDFVNEDPDEESDGDVGGAVSEPSIPVFPWTPGGVNSRMSQETPSKVNTDSNEGVSRPPTPDPQKHQQVPQSQESARRKRGRPRRSDIPNRQGGEQQPQVSRPPNPAGRPVPAVNAFSGQAQVYAQQQEPGRSQIPVPNPGFLNEQHHPQLPVQQPYRYPAYAFSPVPSLPIAGTYQAPFNQSLNFAMRVNQFNNTRARYAAPNLMGGPAATGLPNITSLQPPLVPLPSNAQLSLQQPHTTNNHQTLNEAPRVLGTESRTSCTKCGISHPPSMNCPQLNSAIGIRIALDDLSRTTAGNPALAQRVKVELLGKLKELKLQQAGQDARLPPTEHQRSQYRPPNL